MGKPVVVTSLTTMSSQSSNVDPSVQAKDIENFHMMDFHR